MDLSTPTHAVTEAAARPVGRDDAWVREKGLPRAVRGSLVDQLRGRLLLATDLSDESIEANARAMELAEAASLPLLILGIVARRSNIDRSGRGRQIKRLAALVRAAHQRGIDAEGKLLAGDPARTILRVASSTCAGTIIMGHDQWREPAPKGSISGHVVLHATKPVLLVGAPRRPATRTGGN